MNFRQWNDEFNNITIGSYSNSDYQYVAEESWDACKKEILKLLDSESIEVGDGNVEIKKETIDKIREL